jgi:hypothetical protein
MSSLLLLSGLIQTVPASRSTPFDFPATVIFTMRPGLAKSNPFLLMKGKFSALVIAAKPLVASGLASGPVATAQWLDSDFTGPMPPLHSPPGAMR